MNRTDYNSSSRIKSHANRCIVLTPAVTRNEFLTAKQKKKNALTICIRFPGQSTIDKNLGSVISEKNTASCTYTSLTTGWYHELPRVPESI